MIIAVAKKEQADKAMRNFYTPSCTYRSVIAHYLH